MIGWFLRAAATALHKRAVMVTPFGLSFLYKASNLSVVIVYETRETGTGKLASMFFATADCIEEKGWISPSPTGAGAADGVEAATGVLLAAGEAAAAAGAAGAGVAAGAPPPDL